MGCCGSKDGGAAKKVKLGDIPDKPKVEGMSSVQEVCDALWGVKGTWADIRDPLAGAKGRMQEASEMEEGETSQIAQGLIACICEDMKPGQEDFDGIITCNLECPFVHFTPENCDIVKKYKAVVDAFIDQGKSLISAFDGVEDLISKINEFPGKIQEAADKVKPDIDGIEDWMKKAQAAKACADAVVACKKCCTIMLGDLNNVKGEMMDLKECGKKVGELCQDKSMIKKIGEECRKAKANDISACWKALNDMRQKEKDAEAGDKK